MHVDMDMFYAAVEIRDNPALRGVPMAVGGMGMLTTSNYEARNSVVMNAKNLKATPEIVYRGQPLKVSCLRFPRTFLIELGKIQSVHGKNR